MRPRRPRLHEALLKKYKEAYEDLKSLQIIADYALGSVGSDSPIS